MKKNTITGLQVKKSKKNGRITKNSRLTVGLDLGDRSHRYCVLNEAGEKVSEGETPNTKVALTAQFAKMPRCRIALEVGTHSPWVSRLLASMGHEVIVANPRKVRLITHCVKKNDRVDAEKLARLARVDPKLLSPIQHRGPEAQADLGIIRARAGLVDIRTELVNTARGLVKPMGERLKKCDSDYVKEALAEELSAAAQSVVRPLLKSVEVINQQIAWYDKQIQELEKRYPQAMLLKQIHGVGTLIALTFILTVEDPQRFAHSRDVGPYLGLTRKQNDSGARESELGISKAGDSLLRRYAVQGAHCILKANAPACDLKEWGMTKVQVVGTKGSKKSRKRKKIATVAVARKLVVLLHRLLATGEEYDPHYNRKAAEAAQAKAQRKAKARATAAA